jgi:hypothetical protein
VGHRGRRVRVYGRRHRDHVQRGHVQHHPAGSKKSGDAFFQPPIKQPYSDCAVTLRISPMYEGLTMAII